MIVPTHQYLVALEVYISRENAYNLNYVIKQCDLRL